MPDYQQLVCEEVTLFRVEVDSLERFVAATYGINWSFEYDGYARYSEHAFTVDGKLSDHERVSLTDWLDRDGVDCLYPGPGAVLNELARRSLIRTGEYLVRVSE